MRRLFCATALAALVAVPAGCNTSIEVDPEGLRCDPGDACPPGYSCVQGVCQSDDTACSTVSCTTPPPPTCDGATLKTYAAVGSCRPEDGSCAYAATDTICPHGCQAGTCIGGCATGCVTPPAASCLDASTLRTWAASGTCVAEQCSYASADVPCQNGCSQGRCQNQDLCAGKVCNSPPAPTCVNNQVRTWAGSGTCDANTGVCSYPFTDAPCAGICSDGVCGAVLAFTQIGPRVRHAVTAVDQAPSSSGAHVLAVGPRGAVSRWNGTTWTALASGTTRNLTGVFLLGNTLGYVVGEGGTLLRYDGAQFTPVSLSGAGADLVGVHAAGPASVLVADVAGRYWRFNGTSWTAGTLAGAYGPYRMTSVYVDGAGRQRIAGTCTTTLRPRGCVAIASSPTASFYVDLDGTTTTSDGFVSLGPSLDAAAQGTAFAGRASSATVRRHRNISPYFDDTGAPAMMAGAAVVGIAEAPVAGAQGVFLLTRSTSSGAGALYRHVSNRTFDPATTLLDFYLATQSMSRNESGGVIVADSGATAATVWRRGPLTNEVLDLGESLADAAYGPGGALLMMNTIGDVAIRRPAVAALSLVRSPASQELYELTVASTFALAVGAGGSAYRIDLSGASANPYSAVSSGTTQALRAACRVSDTELYVVGDGGTLRLYNGSTLAPMTSPAAKNLTDVVCLGPGSAVAVGESGTVLRLSNGAWTAPAPAFPNPNVTLTAVGASGGVVFVAGDAAFARLEGNAWSPLPAQPRLAHLVVRAESDVYATSSGTEVVRFDGMGWTNLGSSAHLLRGVGAGGGRVVFVGSGGVVLEGQ